MNKDDYVKLLKDFVDFLTKKGISVVGCNREQISSLEEKQGNLSEFYKLYLKYMGVNPGDFRIGSAMLFSDLNDINEETLVLMCDNNIIPPTGIFTFLMHQGYASLFFTDRDSEDSKIYCYTEYEEIADISYTFSSYLECEIKNHKSFKE
ncbi:SMI1/KNR4 family protein [Xenorhabdus sp. ZM]|uniref:SMI1/KNR4 family protein n=1 Tax=Xenorhabdus szentirmaii TaxID=290112 RepID=UPI00199D4AAF|nr:SMI1/KNR4 family protein [Xenorhabdus sp. ZM]MBD2806992.1 SMI1/KNR4 family protein [Xenorhabdus sp. ZM]